jgi:hypothetical protein
MRFARFLRLFLKAVQHVNGIIKLRYIKHSECSRGTVGRQLLSAAGAETGD